MGKLPSAHVDSLGAHPYERAAAATRRRLAFLVLGLLAVETGCVGMLPTIRRPLRVVPADAGWKVVVEKEPPSTLIAKDGSTCVVTEDRFSKTTHGERVLCAWMSAGRTAHARHVGTIGVRYSQAR